MYGDPDFSVHQMMASYWGTLTLRIADSTILPFNHTDQGLALEGYVESLEELLASKEATHRVRLGPLRKAVKLYQYAATSTELEISLER